MKLLGAVFALVVRLGLAQEVQKTVQVSAPGCYPDVNGAKTNDTVTVHYTGRLKTTGKQFDSSVGGEPISFQLGSGLVIQGWEQGLVGTCPGEKVKLEIPSELGYGSKGELFLYLPI